MTGEGVLIDPGAEPQKILKELSSVESSLLAGKPIQIKYLLHTHAHLDHVGATREVKQASSLSPASSARIALHRLDEPLYQQLKMQGALFGFQYEDPLPVEEYLEEGQEIRFGNFRLTVIHTPGHTPGSVCLRLHEDSRWGASESLFTGDTLFARSIGRTDLWGADHDTMMKSIHQRILTLDGDTQVCPGHGPDSIIGVEKRKNPFLV